MALKIKNVELKTNFILSPMAGITNEAYRMLAMEYGAGMTVCEMVSDKALYYKNEKTFNMTKVNPLEHPVSLQIFGHDIDTMVKAFSLAGYDEEVVKNKFRSLYTAFKYGAPPHAGMAPGIDRIIMLLTGEENLREVQVFPPNVSGVDVLMGGPTEVTEQQLRETHLKIRD